MFLLLDREGIANNISKRLKTVYIWGLEKGGKEGIEKLGFSHI